MQAQTKTAETHRTVPYNTLAKHNSEGSGSSRSSTSSWIDEPVQSVNMDIKTGHLILVCRLL
jgi:hypothetical protein